MGDGDGYGYLDKDSRTPVLRQIASTHNMIRFGNQNSREFARETFSQYMRAVDVQTLHLPVPGDEGPLHEYEPDEYDLHASYCTLQSHGHHFYPSFPLILTWFSLHKDSLSSQEGDH